MSFLPGLFLNFLARCVLVISWNCFRDPTVVFLLERTVLLKWAWRTLLCSGPCQAVLFSTHRKHKYNIIYFDFIFSAVTFKFFRDAVACERAVELAANTKGICYIRLSRPATEIIYDNEEEFAIGKKNLP